MEEDIPSQEAAQQKREPLSNTSSTCGTPSVGLNADSLPQYTTKTLKLSDSLAEFRHTAFAKLIEHIDIAVASQLKSDELREEVENFIIRLSDEQQVQLNYREQQQIATDIVNDMIGLGPLEPLMGDSDITDIMVNSPHSIYVERFGELAKTDLSFRDHQHVFQVAQRIASKVGRRIDESSPMVDARLKDGSRVNVIIPPISLKGVTISIRRFSKERITFDKMVQLGSLGQNVREFLRIVGRSRLNILCSGGTGAGKTTLLNAIVDDVNPRERIITIEDSAELNLPHPHVIRLESRPPNIEGSGEVAIRDLVRNALRMRPDRIIIGECRGPESFDMLQAMNTGHDGSMSTLHANSAQDALSRLENMVLMAGHSLPVTVIKQYIADAIDVIVHISRMRDGIRRVTQVTEILGCQNDEILGRILFQFQYIGVDKRGKILGKYQVTDVRPKFYQKVEYFGLADQLMKTLAEGSV